MITQVNEYPDRYMDMKLTVAWATFVSVNIDLKPSCAYLQPTAEGCTR